MIVERGADGPKIKGVGGIAKIKKMDCIVNMDVWHKT